MIDFEKEQWFEEMSNDDVINGLRHPYTIDYVYDGEMGDWKRVPKYTDKFRIIGELLLKSIAENLEVSSFVNKVLAVRQIRSGEVIRYDKDRDMVSYIVGENSQPKVYAEDIEQPLTKRTPKERIEQRSEGRYVYPEEVEYSVYPSIKAGEFLKDIKLTGQELAKIQRKAYDSMQYQQDNDLINLLLKAGEENQIEANPMEIIQSLIYKTEAFGDWPCASILMNVEDANFIRENRDKFPGVKLTEDSPSSVVGKVAKYGYFGNYNKIALFTQSQSMTEALRNEEKRDLVPKDTMIAVAPKEYVGGAPVRINWMSNPNEEEIVGRRVFGWFYYKLMSMLVINSKTVVVGKIKR